MNYKQITILTITMLLGLSMAVPSALAADLDDGFTGESEVSGNTHTVNNYTANASKDLYMEVNASATVDNNMVLEIEDGASDEEEIYVTYSKDWNETDSSNNHYEYNYSHDMFSTLPMEAGANETFTFRVFESGDESNNTTVDVTFENSDSRTVFHHSDEDDPETVNSNQIDLSGAFSFDLRPNVAEADGSADLKDTEDRTVRHVVSNSNMQDNLSVDATEGDWAHSIYATSGGVPIKVFEASDEDDPDYDDSDLTYAEHDEVHGQEVVDIHYPDDADDENTDSTVAPGKGYGVLDVFEGFGTAPGFDVSDAWGVMG